MTTVSGGSLPAQFTGASGAVSAFSSYFNSTTNFAVFSGSGVSTVTGPLVVASPQSSVTVNGASAVVDTTAGGNAITLAQKTTLFAAPNDTVSSAVAATIFGGGAGVTQFTASGNGSSITGGTGGIVGTASGANSTLVGGTGNSIYTVTGSNSLAVAGPSAVTGINESASTGPETIATNPLGNSGTLVATLGAGADSVIGGGGASTVTAGTGSDVFAFIKGHAGGSEVIIGYNASDNIAFAGYGYTATNLPSEAVGSVGDVITLSDGTTITLAGVDHKIF
jgi:Ca2+-binding RTX toxin-like protein